MRAPMTFWTWVRLAIAFVPLLVLCFAEAAAYMANPGWGRAVERWLLDPLMTWVDGDMPVPPEASS